MRWMRFSIFLLVVTLLNAGNLLNTISVSSLNIRPNLLVILLVFFAGSCPGFEAITASFAIGFAADISGPVMGPAFLSFGLFGWLLRQSSFRLRKYLHSGFQKSLATQFPVFIFLRDIPAVTSDIEG